MIFGIFWAVCLKYCWRPGRIKSEKLKKGLDSMIIHTDPRAGLTPSSSDKEEAGSDCSPIILIIQTSRLRVP